MAFNEKPARSAKLPWPWWRWVLTGLITLALALSSYLAWHYLAGGEVIGCSGGSSCEQVLNSRWSTIGGALPVSALAQGAYLAMLIASFSIGPNTPAPVRRLAWRAMLVLVGAAAGSALWFIAVQKWMVGAFCPYCMTAHITGLLLAALIIWRAPKEVENSSASKNEVAQRIIGRKPTIGMAATGITVAGIMAICQVAITPPVVYRDGESKNALPAIDPRTAPLVGSPTAPYVVTLLFDYKCPHCQQLHFMLNEAVRRYQGKLAFALCPSPLNTKCNPHIPRDVDEFKDSCELTKIALTVWVANRESFAAFDLWMFSLESGDRWRPRTLEAAKAKAVELVGQAKFDAAWADPWVDRYVQSCVKIYGSTIDTNKPINAVPKLVFGSRWVVPQLNDANDLVSILQNSLALPQP